MPLTDAARGTGIAAIGALLNGGKLQLLDSGLTTVLVEFSLPSPAFGSASAGVITANAISGATVSNSGNAEAFRLRQSDNTLVWERSSTDAVGATGSGALVILSQATTALVSGASVSVVSFSMQIPAGT